MKSAVATCKQILYVETEEPKLKAFYNMMQVAKILHIKYVPLVEKVEFLFNTNYPLPKDLLSIKKKIKRTGNDYFIRYTYIKKIELLLQLLKEKYKGAYYDYIMVRQTSPRKRAQCLQDNNTDGFLRCIVKKRHFTEHIKIRKRDFKLSKEKKKKRKIDMLKRIYKKEGLNYEM